MAFIIDIAVKVLHKYLRRCILQGSTLEDYLLKNIHIFVHIQYGLDNTCCKQLHLFGKSKNKNQERHLNFGQFKKLFREDKTKSCKSNQKTKKAKCCCCSFVPENIDVGSLDISLMCSIMYTCVDWTNRAHERAQIDHIRNVRNIIFHSSDSKSVDQKQFESLWDELSYPVKYIAKTISSDEEKHVEKQISDHKKMIRISEDDLKIKQLCLDYWKDKCLDFEVSLH